MRSPLTLAQGRVRRRELETLVEAVASAHRMRLGSADALAQVVRELGQDMSQEVRDEFFREILRLCQSRHYEGALARILGTSGEEDA